MQQSLRSPDLPDSFFYARSFLPPPPSLILKTIRLCRRSQRITQMTKRNPPAPDFSSDFSFLNESPAEPQTPATADLHAEPTAEDHAHSVTSAESPSNSESPDTADEVADQPPTASAPNIDFSFLGQTASESMALPGFASPESDAAESPAPLQTSPVVAPPEAPQPATTGTPIGKSPPRPAMVAITPESPAPRKSRPATSTTGKPAAAAPADSATEPDAVAPVTARRPGTIAVPAWLVGYTAALTLVLLFLLLTGRIHLSGNHVLESLPDVRPLAPNEFQPVDENMELPAGHTLGLGESRRFGDVRVTPLHVSREPLLFQNFLTGAPEPKLTTPPALKLHLRFENLAADIAFPPFDVALMSHRHQPEASDLSILANSFVQVPPDAQHEFPRRLLNYPQTMDSNFVLAGQNAGKVVAPGGTLETWVATDPLPEDWAHDGPMRWRVQFRKGVHRSSRNGVTTLIDVQFSSADIKG